MDDGRFHSAGDLGDTADVPGRDDLGLCLGDVGHFAGFQSVRDPRLQQIVGAGRPAAEMRFRNIAHREPHLLEQALRERLDFLAVLHRAGGVIGHPVVG